MTTDTFPKEAAMRGRLGGREVTIGGIAKGSGMIAPKMATMLSFITTDMKIGRASLHKILRDAADVSFNRITVDGDTSTNDTVLCMANGLSETTAESAVLEGFREMLIQVTTRLAKMIVMDGEGATKLVEIRVTGARSTRDAGLAAFAIANSSLVKTTFFGEDPNWGRIMAAIGYSGAVIQEDRIAISFEGVPVARKGMGLGGDLENQAREVMRRREFVLSVDLGMGKGETVVWTSDLSYDYVKINVAYRS
jgi:glutamate N-acetyltransferase/amino-acid N-acetyltransferase